MPKFLCGGGGGGFLCAGVLKKKVDSLVDTNWNF